MSGFNFKSPKVSFLRLILIFWALFSTSAAFAESGKPFISFKGFGTLAVTGTDTNALGFRRNISTSRGVGRTWDIPTDSRLGLQIDAVFTDNFSSTIQWTLRDRSGQFFEQNLDLAFLRWNINPDLYIRLGRVSPDIFLLSDHRNVGYAYPWIRPPHEFYAFNPIYHYDGLEITKKFGIDDGYLTFKVFGGYTFSQLDIPGSGLTEQGGTQFTTSLVYEKGNWKSRISYAQLDVNIASPKNPLISVLSGPGIAQIWPGTNRLLPLLDFTGTTLRYTAIGGVYDDSKWLHQAELSYIDSGNAPFFPNLGSGYLSLGRRFSTVTLFTLFGFSKSLGDHIKIPAPLVQTPALSAIGSGLDTALNGNGIDEKSISLGFRWDFHKNMALKAQWSHFWLGKNGTQNFVEDVNKVPPGQLNVLSLGIDFIF